MSLRDLVRIGAVTGAAWLLLCGSSSAPADAASRWLAVGADAGLARYDSKLADYQWDVSARGAWGMETVAGLGPFALGARVAGNSTTQVLGIDGVPDPSVSATRYGLVARYRLVSVLGTDLALSANGGRQHLAYHPSEITLSPGGGAPPVTVDLKPLNSWIGGGGVALRRALVGPWSLTAGFEHDWFALDTAHSAGGTVVTGRETFGMWDLHAGVSWLITSR
jgi:hypothetical protein